MAANKPYGGLDAHPGWTELCRAADDLHAADLLLQDPVATPRTAIPHLRDFWQAMAQAGGAAGHAGAEQGPEAWLAAAPIDARLRQELLTHLQALAGSEPAPLQLRRHARAARTLLAALEPEIGGVPLRRRRRRRLVGAAAALLVFAPLTVFVLKEGHIPGTGPWRAAYFPDRLLESEPVFVREDDVTHDWEDRPPHEEIPPDKFSARWDTCLVLEQDGPVVFQLNANDGARLYLDGEILIDAWDRDAATRRKGFGSGETELEAGVHHLRVEFYESLGGQYVKLVASLDGAVPKALPRDVLRYPGDEFDEGDPCATVRASPEG